MRALTTRLASSLAAPRALPRIDPSLVSAADGARFNEDGAIVVRGVVGPEWLDALRDAAEANLRAPGPLCDEHAEAQGTAGRFHDDQ